MSTPAPPAPPVMLAPRQQFVNTITTALGTVAALMWAEAVKSLFHDGGVFSSFTTYRMAPWWIAIIATFLAIWGSRALVAFNNKVESRLKKKAAPPKKEEDDDAFNTP